MNVTKPIAFLPAAATLGSFLFVTAVVLHGQTPQENAPPQTPPLPRPAQQIKTKRFTFGVRGRLMPVKSLSVMGNHTLLDTITLPAPAHDYNYETSTHSPKWGAGISLDYEISPQWIVTVDALFNKMRYTKHTAIMSGSDDPNTAQDDRSHIFIDEDTRARFYEFPVLVHHRLSKLYVAGGAAFRTATNISSFSTIKNPDASTTTNRAVMRPSHRNVVGAVIGVGARIFDDFHLNWTPEIRFTRWASSTYGTTSSISPKNQLEFGLGFTF